MHSNMVTKWMGISFFLKGHRKGRGSPTWFFIAYVAQDGLMKKWMGISYSIYQMHNTYMELLHLFLQLADSNAKEIKSKTKEWNDRIKQDKVSETGSVHCIIFCVHWFPWGIPSAVGFPHCEGSRTDSHEDYVIIEHLFFSWNIVGTTFTVRKIVLFIFIAVEMNLIG